MQHPQENEQLSLHFSTQNPILTLVLYIYLSTTHVYTERHYFYTPGIVRSTQGTTRLRC